MTFQKGHKLSTGRPKGPEKSFIHRTILKENADKLKALALETGWKEGELLDMLIQRAKISNIKVKK